MFKRGRGRPRKDYIPVEEAEFFKIYLPQLCADKLQIPPDFVKDFHKTIRERIVLKVQGKKTWQVDVEENPKGVFVTNGWTGFVSDNCLDRGDFLVFKYEKCFAFSVKIFGINGCKKGIHVANDTTATRIKIEDSEEEEEEEEIKETQPRRRSARLA